MSQKRNKIIVLVGVLLIIICLLFIISSRVEENLYIQQKCPISPKTGFAVCEIYYQKGANDLKEARIINKFDTEENNKYAVLENTPVLINVDLYNILNKTQPDFAKKNIFKKISLCAQLKNTISDINVYLKNATKLTNDNIICFKPSYLYFNRPKLVITGRTRQTEIDNIPVVLNVYQVPDKINNSFSDADIIVNYLNNDSFLFKLFLFRISKNNLK
jgi:hypothetical protein